jgi:hypothetical protein
LGLKNTKKFLFRSGIRIFLTLDLGLEKFGSGIREKHPGSATTVKSSVADPGCLSRIPDPDFYPSRIPDPKTAMKDRGEKNCCYTFFLEP